MHRGWGGRQKREAIRERNRENTKKKEGNEKKKKKHPSSAISNGAASVPLTATPGREAAAEAARYAFDWQGLPRKHRRRPVQGARVGKAPLTPFRVLACWPQKKRTKDQPALRLCPSHDKHRSIKTVCDTNSCHRPATCDHRPGSPAREKAFSLSRLFFCFFTLALHSRRPSAVPAKTLPQIASAGSAAYLGRIQARRQRCFVCH